MRRVPSGARCSARRPEQLPPQPTPGSLRAGPQASGRASMVTGHRRARAALAPRVGRGARVSPGASIPVLCCGTQLRQMFARFLRRQGASDAGRTQGLPGPLRIHFEIVLGLARLQSVCRKSRAVYCRGAAFAALARSRLFHERIHCSKGVENKLGSEDKLPDHRPHRLPDGITSCAIVEPDKPSDVELRWPARSGQFRRWGEIARPSATSDGAFAPLLTRSSE
jgi:hypothetical protein